MKVNDGRKTVYDDVLGKSFAASLMRSCPHPSVRRNYGVGGNVNVSVYVCRKCRYRKEYELHGGVSCTYDPLKE